MDLSENVRKKSRGRQKRVRNWQKKFKGLDFLCQKLVKKFRSIGGGIGGRLVRNLSETSQKPVSDKTYRRFATLMMLALQRDISYDDYQKWRVAPRLYFRYSGKLTKIKL